MPDPSISASRSSVISPSPPRETPEGTGPTARPGRDDADHGEKSIPTTASPQLKCPYLAGRPPHGSHHLSPSGANVCYARPREEKPYSQVSKGTQAARCFCGTEPFERCPDYERARSEEIALPVFDGLAEGHPRTTQERVPRQASGRRRMKRRHRHSPLQRWVKENGRSTLICTGCVIVALAAFIMILRSM